MSGERDLFANFERMRREMDELFGDVFGAARTPHRRGHGFSPAVDVFYADDPPRAVVHAELAGIDIDEIGLEIEGRELVISGHRRPAVAEGRVYQQLEIDFGPFRRKIPLGADVVAEQAGEHAARAGVGRLVLTHITDELDGEEALAAARHAFGGPVELAREGAVYEV